MSEALTESTVRHIAALARLDLDDQQVEQCTVDLASILELVQALEDVDVTDVEPMAHPIGLVNRLAADRVEEGMSAEQVMQLAPMSEAGLIAVPKVLSDSEGSG